MKQKDIILIVAIVIFSGVFSMVLSRAVFGSSTSRQMKAEVVDVITSDFASPPKKYFNANSIDPTQLIQIGGTNNPNPFNSRP